MVLHLWKSRSPPSLRPNSNELGLFFLEWTENHKWRGNQNPQNGTFLLYHFVGFDCFNTFWSNSLSPDSNESGLFFWSELKACSSTWEGGGKSRWRFSSIWDLIIGFCLFQSQIAFFKTQCLRIGTFFLEWSEWLLKNSPGMLHKIASPYGLAKSRFQLSIGVRLCEEAISWRGNLMKLLKILFCGFDCFIISLSPS